MEQIRYTFIIPSPEFDPQLPALRRLTSLLAGSGSASSDREWEIIVAVGRSPSTQRNTAAAIARGGTLVFLDSDSEPAEDYLSILESSEPFDVAGGPAMLLQPAPYLQHLFHEVLAHSYIVGPTAARYRPTGKLRPTNESELILCNLAVKRECFEKVGPFDDNLYPNEENDWLDRAASLDTRSTRHPAHPIQPVPLTALRIIYQPALRIRRPQRGTWREFCGTMMRYGTGRTRQFLRSGRWNPAKQGLLIGLVLFGISMLVRPLTTSLALLAIGSAAAGAIMVTREPYIDEESESPAAGEKGLPSPENTKGDSDTSGPVTSWQVALTGLTVPFFYAAGQLMGFLPRFGFVRRHQNSSSVKLYNENGELISPSDPEMLHKNAVAQ